MILYLAESGGVAPHGGAWIETVIGAGLAQSLHVAPHGGAWIETLGVTVLINSCWSPLTEGRGLKHKHQRGGRSVQVSPLTEGRGLKLRFRSL